VLPGSQLLSPTQFPRCGDDADVAVVAGADLVADLPELVMLADPLTASTAAQRTSLLPYLVVGPATHCGVGLVVSGG
jgi:hypothetical protein